MPGRVCERNVAYWVVKVQLSKGAFEANPLALDANLRVGKWDRGWAHDAAERSVESRSK